MYKRDKLDVYWIQVILVICGIITYAACMLSMSAIRSVISWEIFKELNPIELFFIIVKVILTLSYAVLLLLPIFINISAVNKFYDSGVAICGYFLGIMSLLVGFGLMLAYITVIVKVKYLTVFMIGLTEVVTGVAALLGKFAFDGLRAGAETKAYAGIQR